MQSKCDQVKTDGKYTLLLSAGKIKSCEIKVVYSEREGPSTKNSDIIDGTSFPSFRTTTFLAISLLLIMLFRHWILGPLVLHSLFFPCCCFVLAVASLPHYRVLHRCRYHPMSCFLIVG
ncbi:hypothetical protein C8R48DRAFT_351061 [Suillus tomentosus]|nr:hypothetical protein C8R48DRAFT_351061 [Suillus tomentosus]